MIKTAKIRIFGEGNTGSKLIRLNAPHGQVFSIAALEERLDDLVKELELSFKGHRFHWLQVTKNQFNVVHVGRIAPEIVITDAGEA